MLSKDKFVELILEGPTVVTSKVVEDSPTLPGLYADFGFEEPTENASIGFAQWLLEQAAGFGNAQHIEREEVILGDNPAARSLPKEVLYWRAIDRPYQTLLFELEKNGIELLQDNLFNELRKQQRLEDAIHRLIQYIQEGFSKGGEKRTASVKQGQPKETLIIVSVSDNRDNNDEPINRVFFATVSSEYSSFETFQISDEPRSWAKEENRSLAEDHLSRLYYRHFSKLATPQWQDAFLTSEERECARKLLEACTQNLVDARTIEDSAKKLVKAIAKSFGRGYQSAKLAFDELPSDHFIGVDPKAIEQQEFKNPFQGMTIHDERNRLLGYVIYCIEQKSQADKLRSLLEKHNSFHNVLVIYPEGDEAVLELWQGTRPLRGKMTKKGAQFSGEGEVVNL